MRYNVVKKLHGRKFCGWLCVVLLGSYTLTVSLDTMAERAWHAFNCLPRERGGMPVVRSLEERFGLSNGSLKKLFTGAQPRAHTLPNIIRALRVSYEWLLEGHGERPRLTDKFLPLEEWLRRDPSALASNDGTEDMDDPLAEHPRPSAPALPPRTPDQELTGEFEDALPRAGNKTDEMRPDEITRSDEITRTGVRQTAKGVPPRGRKR